MKYTSKVIDYYQKNDNHMLSQIVEMMFAISLAFALDLNKMGGKL